VKLGLWDEGRNTDLGVFEKIVLRIIFGRKRDEVTGGWKNCIMRSIVICSLHLV
jgi:hypothetical protein